MCRHFSSPGAEGAFTKDGYVDGKHLRNSLERHTKSEDHCKSMSRSVLLQESVFPVRPFGSFEYFLEGHVSNTGAAFFTSSTNCRDSEAPSFQHHGQLYNALLYVLIQN
ncbi:hypothetical protein KUCAC02_009317 [Chaenocephalus aceratus]|uniref:Uncharacterized protein n=1 Tax=Chaenocephalus aceratus TaxID=36190 RepID=A0ACB9WU24_CHAAC|nr:hypothetical protein KUCAC02_009317 [Chaenocephalus aceratus]